MDPAWTQFESQYKDKLKLVYVNVDEKTTKEFTQYSKLLGQAIPHTVWLNKQDQPVNEQTGAMSLSELSAASDKALAAP
jgi:thioredoxin-like negative regulator of GroEL